MLSGISLLIAAYIGMFMLAGLLPIVAGFLLDGVVQVLRSNGLRYLLIALGMTVAVALVGYFIHQYGMTSAAMTATNRESVTKFGAMFLTFSIPLAVLAFLFRTVDLLLSKKRRVRR